MANSVTHAALPFPVKGARYTLQLSYVAAGAVPTDPTSPDTERSIDGAAFADCTEEATIATGSVGMGYITLTGDEMNASMVQVAAKGTGTLTGQYQISPRVLPMIATGTASAGGATSITVASGGSYVGCIVKTTGGTGGAGGSGSLNNQARVIVDYDPSDGTVTVSPAWETNPDNTTTYVIYAAPGAVTAALSTIDDAPNTISSALDSIEARLPTALTAGGNIKADALAISGDATAADNAEAFFDGTGYAGTNNVIPLVTTTTTATNVTNVNGIASGVITATAIAADAIGSAEISAAAIAKIADAVLRRQADNAEASSDGDTLDLSSLYGLIQQAQESAISGTTLTVKKTDGSTTLGTKTVAVDGTTGNITGIS